MRVVSGTLFAVVFIWWESEQNTLLEGHFKLFVFPNGILMTGKDGNKIVLQPRPRLCFLPKKSEHRNDRGSDPTAQRKVYSPFSKFWMRFRLRSSAENCNREIRKINILIYWGSPVRGMTLQYKANEIDR